MMNNTKTILALAFLLLCQLSHAQKPAETADIAPAISAGDGQVIEIPPAPEKSIEAEFELNLEPEDESLLSYFSMKKLEAIGGENSLIPIFEEGGPIMWPLLLASILAMGTVLDRIFFLIRIRSRRDSKAMVKFFTAVGKGELDEAIRISNASKYYVLRTLGYALSHKDKSLANALLFAQEREMKRFRRGIPMLDTVITLAPLLGLLGTVTGMMGSFALIGGDLSTPGAITGGIAEALIATAFGLGIAITSLLPFNYLNNKMEEARLEIESSATQLELLMLPHTRGSAVKHNKTPNPSKTTINSHQVKHPKGLQA